MVRGSGHGIIFEAPLPQEKEILVGFVFVDDSEIAEGDLTKTEIIIEDVYIRTQKAIDIWEGCLKSTGLSTRLDKSFVYPISFKCYD